MYSSGSVLMAFGLSLRAAAASSGIAVREHDAAAALAGSQVIGQEEVAIERLKPSL
jgi:hypothetical protein